MATIIPRTQPDITRIDPLPGVRNEARVSSAPMEGVADAVRGLAATAGDVYQQQQDRADAVAYAEAQRKLSEWRNHWYDPNNADGVAKYKGREALKLGDSMLPDFDTTTNTIMQSLPSDRVRQKFAEYAGVERTQVGGEVNRYATAQNDAYIASERKAYLDTQQNELVKAQLTDPARYKTLWATTLDTLYANAAANGESSKAAALQAAQLESAVHSSVMDQLQSTDPIAAADYYAEHADRLQEDDRARVLRTIQPLLEDSQGDADADWAVSGAPGEAEAAHEAGVQATYASLGAAHGFRTTSITRNKAENAAVGGVANSQHLDTIGTARDWSVKGKTPEQIGAFVADLKAKGFEVITKPHGTGPHIHAELPRQRLASHGLAGSEADALERIQAIADPRRRQTAERKVRDRFQINRLREQETDRATVEQINTAVWTGDPTKSLKELLGPQGYAYAASKGSIQALENDLKYRRESPTRTDVPTVVGEYLSAFRENPKAFAKMDVLKNARHMSAETAQRLTAMQADVRAGKYDVADVSTENDQLNALVFGPLNMVGETAEAKKKRAGFEAAWDAAKLDWARNNAGKKLTSDTRDQLIRRLRVAYALNGGGNTFEKFAPTDAQRADAARWLRDTKGIKNPSDEQVNRVILLASGNG